MEGGGAILKSQTPMMKQYDTIKKSHEDAILFFRMGDFYETFYDDAKKVSKELDIVLTSRKSKSGKIPLAGIPYHAVDSYLGRLIKKGYKVAICEQVEDPKLARGIVKREVTRIVTPGTVLEGNILDSESNNFLMGLVKGDEGYGLAFVDVSTGEFFTTQIDAEKNKLISEMARFKPSECILSKGLSKDENLIRFIKESVKGIIISPYDDEHFDHDRAYKALVSHFKTMNLEGMGCEDLPLAVNASGAVMSYLEETQKASLGYIDALSTYSISDYMILDSTTLRNLEVMNNIHDGSTTGTLFEMMNKTITSMGSRLLQKWIQQPLLDVNMIKLRQNAVEEFFGNTFLRHTLKDQMMGVRDIERLISRIVYGNASARDLVSLKESLKAVPHISRTLEQANLKFLQLKKIHKEMDDLSDIVDLIQRAIVPEPPATVREGGMIRDGYNEDLDQLRSTSRGGKDWIVKLERSERRRTGIKSLKVGYNKVFGYYIDVTKPHLSKVPNDYIRKQTLVNAERFVTPELKEKEALVLSAEDKIEALEYELFTEIKEKVALESARVQRVARAIAALDCLSCLAEVAVVNNYTKPEIMEGDSIKIENGRHPVVEHAVYGEFVPNNTHIDCGHDRLIILTGPNMAGKSTYMRQVALITIMAQMGSFVPADSASIGVVDRVYTRVGAFDDLTRGQSTFMVEMTELANILNTATPRSLIILDEIGRGTSTFDGLSIAWAVAEYLHNTGRVGAKTLFATHFHNLTELAEVYDGVANYNIAVKEDKDDIIFLRKVVPGGTDKSYGIQVARLAGIPKDVINRAKDVLKTIEEENIVRVEDESGSASKIIPEDSIGPRPRKLTQLVLFEPNPIPNPVLEEIKKLDLTGMSPLEALNKLSEIQKELEEKEGNEKQ